MILLISIIHCRSTVGKEIMFSSVGHRLLFHVFLLKRLRLSVVVVGVTRRPLESKEWRIWSRTQVAVVSWDQLDGKEMKGLLYIFDLYSVHISNPQKLINVQREHSPSGFPLSVKQQLSIGKVLTPPWECCWKRLWRRCHWNCSQSTSQIRCLAQKASNQKRLFTFRRNEHEKKVKAY